MDWNEAMTYHKAAERMAITWSRKVSAHDPEEFVKDLTQDLMIHLVERHADQARFG